MYRTVPYIVLFLILALLQIFLFDNLSISIYLCPLVYIGFIVLLPIDAPPVAPTTATVCPAAICRLTESRAGTVPLSAVE